MSDIKKKAKLDALKEVRAIASEAMKNGLKGSNLKKVSVIADSKEGLEEGLDKAKEISKEIPEAIMEDAEDRAEDYIEDEAEEIHENEESDSESLDEIEAKIKELMEKKQKLAKK